MRILINASNLKVGGSFQVADSFIRELVNHPEHTYLIVPSGEILASLGDVSNYPDFVSFAKADVAKVGIVNRLLRRNPALSRLEKEFKPDVVFTVFGPSYWTPEALHVCGFARGHYIYPDTPYWHVVSKKEALKFKFKGMLHMKAFLRDATAFITETEDAAKRLQRCLKTTKVYTVSNTYSQVFDDFSLHREYKLDEFDGTTLLTVSAGYIHKNLQIIPETARCLKKKYPEFKFRFVVTVQPEELGFDGGNVPDWLLPVGRVDISECPSLYRQCDIVLQPTLLEIFSANYPEAMKSGKVILTSDLAFAHDICRDAAVYFDPLDPESLGDKIYEISISPELRNRLVSAGNERLKAFNNAAERAKKYLNILEAEYADAAGVKGI